MIVTEESVHHLADITQASSPYRMVARTLAIAQALLCFYSFHEGGAAIVEHILTDILTRVSKAMANQVCHSVSLPAEAIG
jgi:hypothetical protein